MKHPFWRPLGVTTLGLTLLLGTSSAFAQDTTPQELGATDTASGAAGEVYQAAYFEKYAPSSASDMVSQIPGFQVSGGGNKRGLGQGGANILLNGERLTGKSGAFDQLGRITAKNVVRIEIVDGASLDIPGLSGQVANVITKTSGISGTYSWEPEWRKGLEANLGHVHFTVNGETGNLAYSAELRQEYQRNGHWGPEQFSSIGGTLIETRDENAQYYSETPGASVDLTWKPKADHVGNLNFSYNDYNFNRQETSIRTAITDDGEDIQTLATGSEDEHNYTIGGDYELPLGPGKLKTIGYYRFEHSPTQSRFDVFDNTGQISGSRFFRVADEAETIARSEYSWSPSEGRDWQIGVEGAFNYLDIESSLLARDDDGQFTNRPLTGATSRVEEKRAEATMTHSRALSPKWDVQASLGVEYSELSQMSAETSGAFVRDFIRPKGFLTATYKPSDSLSIRTKIEREVGQLNFFDFISSVDLSDDLDTQGNINLVPSQNWRGEVEFDKDFGDGNTFKVQFYGLQISDLVDRIPIGLDGDAVGNIDSAQQYGVDFNATVKGDKWGWKGTELTLQLELRNSSVDDPLTGISRRLNGDKKSYWFAEFRHDIPDTDWAYGIAADRFRQSAAFRLNTIGQFDNANPFGRAYIEHKDIFGLKVRAQVLNLFGSRDDFTRQYFTARRDQGSLEFIETRQRSFDEFFNLRISGTF